MKIQHGRTFASLVGIACIAGGAFAQGLISTSGVVVADIGDTVPDYAGAPMAGFTFGGSGNFDGATIDENGNVLFRARFIDNNVPSTTTTFNDRAYFKGSSRATLQMVVRGGDQAPTMTTGYLLRTTTGSSTSLPSSCRIVPNGDVFWGSNIFDSLGSGGITAADDECWFGGPVGAQTMLLRQGSAAPGTTGATFAQAFSGVSQQTQSMDRNGNLCFFATLTGGDVVGTTNQQGIWWGPPASLTLVQRKGEAANGIPGTFVSTTNSSALGFTISCNTAGQVFYEIVLDNTLGNLPPTTADRAMMLWSAGAGHQVIIREGDTAPGTAGATYNNIAGSATESWTPGFSANLLRQSGAVIFTSTLKGGDVVGTDNDLGVFRGTPGSIALVARENDPAPGTDGVFATFNNTNTLHNDGGKVCLQASIRGGTVTTANDSGIWMGTPGNLQLIIREGDVDPVTGGTFGSISGISTYFNDRDQIVVGTITLTGGTSPGSSTWLYNPGQGLVPICLTTSQVEVLPTVFKTCTGGIGGNSVFNTDGAALAFNHDGQIGTRVGFTDGTAAIMVITLPDPIAGTPFCFGDGLDLSHTTPCPCANNGTAGNGCANSVNASGANLAASGSTFADDVVLEASLMPGTSSCIYLQGDGLEDTTFGDGVRCAGGSLIRLRTRFNVAGASTFPDSTDTITLSARGGVVPGSGAVRYYQTYYRNAAALFCPPETFNVTNGMVITW